MSCALSFLLSDPDVHFHVLEPVMSINVYFADAEPTVEWRVYIPCKSFQIILLYFRCGIRCK